MKPESSAERAFRRRLALLALLHQRPYCYRELVTLLEQKHLFVYDYADDDATIARLQRYQFRFDLRALRSSGCNIQFDQKSQCYFWRNSPFQLVLRQSEIASFALLLDTFEKTTFPHSADIQALLVAFIERLPTEQQQELRKQRRAFSIRLQETTDYHSMDRKTLDEIEKAIQRGQRLEFIHRRPRDGKERRHVIEPRPLVYENGHVYLYGWSIDYEQERHFRLDYIKPGSAKILHSAIVRSRPAAPTYTLRYRLNAAIARNGVSQHFDEQQVVTHDDGSVTITASTTDLFSAYQILLKYAEHCTVLEPPELVANMRVVRDHFNTVYPTPEG
jgi:predicted DNA-binding transcriptional regulator YafY